MTIIGIDLGTTNSLAAIWKDGRAVLIPNCFGKYLTPSVVYTDDDDSSVWVGAVAKEKRLLHPQNGVDSFKRSMGTGKQYHVGGHSFSSQELSAMVLRQLKADAEAYLGVPVDEAIISVPAYFNDEQRYATKEAGSLAGLRVERLINEPSAAALACRMQTGEEETQFLVIDFGGGTLDVSVVECFDQIIEIQAVSGNNHLGGNDFDRCIAEYFCGEHKLVFENLEQSERAVLLKKAEQCKRELSTAAAAKLECFIGGKTLGMFITGDKFVELAAPLLTDMAQIVRKALSDAAKTIDGIDQIVLVGGSCKMPVICRYIEATFGKAPFLVENPDEIVAVGAGIYAGIKERQSDVRDVLLTDICPFTLGVGIHDRDKSNDLLMSSVIERNSTLPVSRAERYTTVFDGQKQVEIKVYQGESLHCSDNLLLGSLQLPVPPAPAGEEWVVVRFTYDINGILQVEAQNRIGERTERVIINQNVRMSEDEITRRMEELKKLKQNPREEAVNQFVFSRGERLYQEVLGSDRETVARLLTWFSGILNEASPAAAAAARKKIEEHFDYIEQKHLI